MKIKKGLLTTEIEFEVEELHHFISLPKPMFVGLLDWFNTNFKLDLCKKYKVPSTPKENE